MFFKKERLEATNSEARCICTSTSVLGYNDEVPNRAGVVQWQYRSFPSFGRGFDSHRPLQILKDLRSRAGFHYFQNINFVAKLHGKFGANVVERNLSGVAFGHRSG